MLRKTIAVTFLLGLYPDLGLAVGPAPVSLQAHFSVYEVSLKSSRDSAIEGIRGRLAVEFTDSCEGYAQTQRMRMEISNVDGGKVISDSNHSTWESYDGKMMRFTNNIYVNGNSREAHTGRASRLGDKIQIHFISPKIADLIVHKETIFPTEHFINLIRAAKMGETTVSRKIYDGSGPDGNYDSVALIARDKKSQGVDEKFRSKLKGLQVWLINLAYFVSAEQSTTPEYEIKFKLYENGIVTDLVFDYNTFVVNAELSRLDYIESVC